jgi:hypothetical protein
MIKSKDNIQTRGYTAATVKAHRQITQLNFKRNEFQMQQFNTTHHKAENSLHQEILKLEF